MSINVAFWYDTGYTDGCIEVPLINATLSNPDLQFNVLNPSKDRYFSEFRIQGAYIDLYNVSYLRAIYDLNNASSNLTLYGWVDSVDIQSDTDGCPITIVRWHIDNWRTFASRANFGSGMVRRRPVNGDMPPQDYPYRMIIPTDYETICNVYDSNIWYVVLCYQDTDEDNNITTQYFACFPVSVSSVGSSFYIRGYADSNTYEAPSLRDVCEGRIDERLGIVPEAISYIGISPIPPTIVAGSGTQSDPYTLQDWWISSFDNGYQTWLGGYDRFTRQGPYYISNRQTTDIVTYVVTDIEGQTILSLPWGYNVNGYYVRLIPTATSLELALYFASDETASDIVSTGTAGLTAMVNLPSFDLNTNAWSSYVYNGSRQVMADQLALNTQANLVSGVSNAFGAGLTGGLMGASTGLGAGAIGIGAGMGAVVGVAGAALNYAYESVVYNDRMMDINDYEAAHQQSNILLTGSGGSFFNNGVRYPAIAELTKDDYSLQQRANDLEIYGCHVSEPRTSCQSLVNAGGPLQIDNLVVTGDIPVNAKQYIKQRLANGVRIV